MSFYALFGPHRRRWVARLLFILISILPAIVVAACDGGSATPIPEYGGTTASKGQAIFARYCNTCHPGGGRGVGPSLVVKNYGADEIKAVVRHGKAQMPGFGDKVISDDDLDALVDYVIGMRH